MSKIDFDVKSKTLQGLIIVAIPMIASLFNTTVEGETVSLIDDTISKFLMFIGGSWSLLGMRGAILRGGSGQ